MTGVERYWDTCPREEKELRPKGMHYVKEKTQSVSFSPLNTQCLWTRANSSPSDVSSPAVTSEANLQAYHSHS